MADARAHRPRRVRRRPDRGRGEFRRARPSNLANASGGEDALYVADTDNHAIRVVDPANGKTSTLTLRGLAPPASPPNASADANAPSPLTQEFKVDPQRISTNSTATLTINVELPEGYHLNESAPQRIVVSVSNGAQSIAIEGGQTFSRSGHDVKLPLTVPLAAHGAGSAELLARLTAYYCRTDNTGVSRIKTLVWRVAVRVVAEADAPREIKVQGKIE